MYTIRPALDEGLQYSKTELETPFGAIVSRWILQDDEFRISVSVPPGAQCELVLPDGTSKDLGSGSHICSCKLHEVSYV